MGRLLFQRLLTFPLLLLGISAIVFVIGRVIPGDPARLLAGGQYATEADVAQTRIEYGLDRPILEQYGSYLSDLVHGDLGQSLTAYRPVSEVLGERIVPSLELTFCALLIGVPAGIGLGIAAARRRDSLTDNAATLMAITWLSVPLFWLSLIMVWIFAVALKWLPPSGRLSAFTDFHGATGFLTLDSLIAGKWSTFGDAVKHLVLPTLTLAVVPMAILARYTRASFVEVLSQNYIRTAKAYGLPERRIIWRHAAKNAMLPIVTVFGVLVPAILGGSVLVETVFSWPGLGTMIFVSITSRDYAVIQGVTLFFALLYSVSNLLVDLSYGFLDPRTRR